MTIKLDETGRLAFPVEVATRFGLQPGAPVKVEEEAGSLRLRRPVTHLAKLYIEPTVRCNLNCRTCIRNVWDEPGGDMTGATFAAVITGLHSLHLRRPSSSGVLASRWPTRASLTWWPQRRRSAVRSS